MSTGWSRHESRPSPSARRGRRPAFRARDHEPGPAGAARGERPHHRRAGAQAHGALRAGVSAARLARGRPRLGRSRVQEAPARGRQGGLRRVGDRSRSRPPDRRGEYGAGAQRDRLHALLLLSAGAPRHAAHLVQERELPAARRARAARRAEGIRHPHRGARFDPRPRLERRHALRSRADATQRHGRLERGAARVDPYQGHPCRGRAPEGLELFLAPRLLGWSFPYRTIKEAPMAKTVIGLIDNLGEAQAAVRDLVENGIAQEDVGFLADQGDELPGTAYLNESEGMDEAAAFLIAVALDDAVQEDLAAEILRRHGAKNIDHFDAEG